MYRGEEWVFVGLVVYRFFSVGRRRGRGGILRIVFLGFCFIILDFRGIMGES